MTRLTIRQCLASLGLAICMSGPLPVLAQQQGVAVAQTVAAWEGAVGHMRAQEPRAAIPILERLVALMPGEHRFRLELARAYFLVEDDEKASFHFDQASGGPLSEAERTAVAQYQDRIRERQRWEGHLSFAIVPESNPARRTSAETISAMGGVFALDQRAKPETGLQVNARLTFLPQLSRDVSGRLSMSLNARLFETSDFNDITLGAEAGLLRRADRGRVLGGGVSASHRWVGTSAFSYSVGVYGTYETRLGDRSRLWVRGNYDYVTHDYLPRRDGPRYRLHVAVNRVISPQMAVRGWAYARITDARAAADSGTEMGLSFGATYAFEGGLVSSVDVSGMQDKRRGIFPMFGAVRRDRQLGLSVGLLHRNIEFNGYAPRVDLHLERRRSSIELFSFDNARVSLGLTRRF